MGDDQSFPLDAFIDETPELEAWLVACQDLADMQQRLVMQRAGA